MKHIVIILLLLLVLFVPAGCTNSNYNTFLKDAGDALGYAEDIMRDEGLVTASSFHPDKYAKFRIMASNDTSTQEAKQIVEDFIRIFEGRLMDKDKFYRNHVILFDIKSEEDGRIFFSGKKDHDQDLWWQF